MEVVLTSGGGLEVTVSSSPEHTKMSKEEIQEVCKQRVVYRPNTAIVDCSRFVQVGSRFVAGLFVVLL